MGTFISNPGHTWANLGFWCGEMDASCKTWDSLVLTKNGHSNRILKQHADVSSQESEEEDIDAILEAGRFPANVKRQHSAWSVRPGKVERWTGQSFVEGMDGVYYALVRGSAVGSQISYTYEAQVLLRDSHPHDSWSFLLINQSGQMATWTTWTWAQLPHIKFI